jgi:hypothetical protein
MNMSKKPISATSEYAINRPMTKTAYQPALQWKFAVASDDRCAENQFHKLENLMACMRLLSPSLPSANRKWAGVQGFAGSIQALSPRLLVDGLQAGSR